MKLRKQSTKPTTLYGTATADGFRFPSEWELHEKTLMCFPTTKAWRGCGVQKARQEWANVANTLSEYEPVDMAVAPDDYQHAKKMLSSSISLLTIEINDGWSRDTGPQFLLNAAGDKRMAAFKFNGWGEKHICGKKIEYERDALLKERLSEHYGLPMCRSELVSEGGAITTDGQGTIITTEQSMLARNPGLSKDTIETELKKHWGTHVIWLDKGLAPDAVTDGRVDGICCFAQLGVVLLHTTDAKDRHGNYKICQDAKSRLQQATDANGKNLEIIELPLAPGLAHMNFYIANRVVLAPITGVPAQDNPAMGVLSEVFQDRKVIGISATVLDKSGGGIHCITQQIPA